MFKLSQEEMVVNPEGQGDGVYRNQTDPVEELEQVYFVVKMGNLSFPSQST